MVWFLILAAKLITLRQVKGVRMQVNEAQIERYPITTDLYHQMIERGILTENDKIELLEAVES